MTIPNAVLIPEVARIVGEGRTVKLRLKGRSMRPFLQDGRDCALLAAPGNPSAGDVALARIAGDTYVLHRIVAIDGDSVTLQGDGNTTSERCRLGDILAVAVGFHIAGARKPCLVSGFKWRAYSRVWAALRPARRHLLAALGLAGL